MRFGRPAIRYGSVGDSAVDAAADDAGTAGVAADDAAADDAGTAGVAADGVATDGVVSNDVAVDDRNAEDTCREAALRLLDAAPRSSGALRDRLLGKGFDEAVVERVVERMVDLLLINDHDYAESVVRVCAGRMMGRRGAAMELDRKGVDRALAVQVLDEAERQGVFEDAAWELGRRMARKTQGLDRQVRQRRFWAAGGRKGHNPETLRRVAAELFG
ncbi:regulatory protein RecX [Bifidobacterium myosotis]|uniref:Regulatory protein RecX n=1 Tax=Bifidobacterium myosotis TaxID=1630166 RepID=A0A5M9ZLS2_9BIFI|nr:regulatory protein RecX [Bifidobacterium myosotis]